MYKNAGLPIRRLCLGKQKMRSANDRDIGGFRSNSLFCSSCWIIGRKSQKPAEKDAVKVAATERGHTTQHPRTREVEKKVPRRSMTRQRGPRQMTNYMRVRYLAPTLALCNLFPVL